MASETDRCRRYERHRAIHDAFVQGDLHALCAALDDPPDFPNGLMPCDLAVGDHCLEYAIYWSPLPFIRGLLRIGANPNYDDRTGFPSLIAALDRRRSDRHDVLALLLSFDADTQQRGINDWTPLHCAVGKRDLGSCRAVPCAWRRSPRPNPDRRLHDAP